MIWDHIIYRNKTTY